MNLKSGILLYFLLIITSSAFGQDERLVIKLLLKEDSLPISGAVLIVNDAPLAISDEEGFIEVKKNWFKSGNTVYLKHLLIEPYYFSSVPDPVVYLNVKNKELEEFELRAEKERDDQSLEKLSTTAGSQFTMINQSFSQFLQTIPGVIVNNDLSNQYAVRGGNFDENLIFVNDFEIVRPQITRQGQQEGLGVINQQLLSQVDFSTGGWNARYGDKLSSLLIARYDPFESEFIKGDISLLGFSGAVSREIIKDKFGIRSGFRYKNNTPVLNGFGTTGDFTANSIDWQTSIDYKWKSEDNIFRITLFPYVYNNSFESVPEQKQVEFGTFNNPVRFDVAFDGKSEYEASSAGLGYRMSLSKDNWYHDLTAEGQYSGEQELINLESGYRLCDIDNNPVSSSFNQCTAIRGLGTEFEYARNKLIYDKVRFTTNHLYSKNNLFIKFGASFKKENYKGNTSEYSFLDSAGYVNNINTIVNDVTIDDSKTAIYTDFRSGSGKLSYTFGLRGLYWNFGKDFFLMPRAQFSYSLNNNTSLFFNTGRYIQPPSYRAYFNPEGAIGTNVIAQESWHFIFGSNHRLIIGEKLFKLKNEIFYKHLPRLTPFVIDDIRLLYDADRISEGFSTGIESRISGEFIPGTESWLSLSILSTRERPEGSEGDYKRRATDQRFNMAFYLEDHMPFDKSFKIAVKGNFTTGLPFRPPGDPFATQAFTGDYFIRTDVGIGKEFYSKSDTDKKTWQVMLEIINLFGRQNTINYQWVQQVDRSYIGVPENLPGRIVNLSVSLNIDG
ncbi:TonB-dependent receptor plug domain-containing protein [Mangrovivirga sp. M17]|uniref:TonB-dependent receptor plug domain-containing protein n=1 Tax=Mangrovivirga halotolerans TaxID=2993936 RepID=A0ABT3RQL5_9BACT|nr:TonB-dependent receptor plug domain-containing protein [Mangrovivirga halotolerans]MCX2744083.1 TonB-dependent receptor plug domain-containing protein [Mangrovivirga halotolerans]